MIKKHWEKILVIIVTLPLVYIAYLYFVNDSLAVYDAPGHLNIIWYLKEYLWPNFSGWNSFNLLGFDQGRFYPPLFHYLATSLSFFLGIENATKLVIVTALLTLPLGIYYFLHTLFRDIRQRILVTGLIMLSLALLPGYLGANIKALFQVGLLPSVVATPLVFFYLGSLLRIKKIGPLFPTLFLSVLILTHLVAGFFAITFLLATIVSEKINSQSVKIYLNHLATVLLLTAFFWLPFLVQSNQLSSSVHLNSFGVFNAVVLVISLGFVISSAKKINQNLMIVALATLFLSCATTTDYFVEKILPGGFVYEKIYNLHLYRLQVYEILLLVTLLSYYPVIWLYSTLGKVRSRLYFFALVPIITVFLIFILRSPVLIKKQSIYNFNREKISGRFLETFSRENSYPFIYTEQTNLVIKNHVPWAYSLFTDANQNGPFLSSLIRSFEPDNYPKAKTNFIEEKIVDRSRLRGLLDLFAVENFLQINFFANARSDGLDLITTTPIKQDIVEITDYKIRTISNNWEKELGSWWLGRGKIKELLVKVNKKETNVSFNVKEKDSKVEITKKNKDWTKFSILVKASKKQPVLIKFSYSPNWQAYQNGKAIKIYQVSPSLMLVSAKGEIDFKYQTLWYQYLASAVSVFTLFGLIIYFFTRIKGK